MFLSYNCGIERFFLPFWPQPNVTLPPCGLNVCFSHLCTFTSRWGFPDTTMFSLCLGHSSWVFTSMHSSPPFFCVFCEFFVHVLFGLRLWCKLFRAFFVLPFWFLRFLVFLFSILSIAFVRISDPHGERCVLSLECLTVYPAVHRQVLHQSVPIESAP